MEKCCVKNFVEALQQRDLLLLLFLLLFGQYRATIDDDDDDGNDNGSDNGNVRGANKANEEATWHLDTMLLNMRNDDMTLLLLLPSTTGDKQ